MKKEVKRSFPRTARRRSPCPVSSTLDLLGDKWTLLVVRDLWMGKRTYSELQDSPEGIPSNILAERLKRLECAGILDKAPYQEKPPRYTYTLTPGGRDLGPVLLSMLKWGSRHMPGALPEAEALSVMEAMRKKYTHER